jgi:hypothetical protein
LTSYSNPNYFQDEGDVSLIFLNNQTFSQIGQRSPKRVHKAFQRSPKGGYRALALPDSGQGSIALQKSFLSGLFHGKCFVLLIK